MKHLRVILAYFLIYLQLNIKNVNCGRNLETVYTKFECTKKDPKGFLHNITCYVAKNSQRTSLTLEMLYKKDLKRFRVNVLITVPRLNDDFVFLNLTNLNGCQLITNQHQVPFFTQVLSVLNKFGNVLQKCPYKRDTLYYFRGYHMDISTLPVFSFETGMKVIFDFVREGDKLITGVIDSRIQYRRKH